jgi:hypothetical protein
MTCDIEIVLALTSDPLLLVDYFIAKCTFNIYTKLTLVIYLKLADSMKIHQKYPVPLPISNIVSMKLLHG